MDLDVLPSKVCPLQEPSNLQCQKYDFSLWVKYSVVWLSFVANMLLFCYIVIQSNLVLCCFSDCILTQCFSTPSFSIYDHIVTSQNWTQGLENRFY